MGEAQQRAKRLAKIAKFSQPMNPARFDLFSIGARLAYVRLLSDELSCWSDPEERVLGLVFRDRVDNDFGWVLFARDKIGRFRCSDIHASIQTQPRATEALRERIARAVEEGDFVALGDQGDETNYPIDLLRVPDGTDPAVLHPYFKLLIETPGREPARAVFKEIGPWLTPSDPHFVKEFQRSAFDQRLWELYLWASFRELGFDIEQPEAPDFLCSAPGITFTVEATTTAPSTSGVLAEHPNPKTPEEMRAFLADYMPMKFGSALTSKLHKKNKNGENYWERGKTANKPFIIAVADYHKPSSEEELGSMTYTQSALWPYLYGHRIEFEIVDGELITRAVKNEFHTFGDKTIPSGFFDLPGAENVSAVIFSNAGTLAKFDRMGVIAGFDLEDHRYLRYGLRQNPDPNVIHGIPFSEEVTADGYEEFWSDEL
ncbi:hypothetical protein OGR47_05875 [Methylocystis sp. MJC1]|jgi:hypothetical protein|uniref:hypothetical protein n=1 Tax=Methylocystis sp. MJC1 TaxID=2654282 RepID=UPI001FEFD3B0|nr:hypothetical protein [Methylocystis sp. MJC1]KAF2992560.1 hypothetical protein MJC1_00137 [Methylocystis sp. MJC1]UZX12973.1 hypothetical protein OGR47_05875 [Methylocystis sp. MJC1]